MTKQEKFKIIDNVIYTPDVDITPDPKGLGHYYYTQMKSYENKVAQIDGYTKEEDTFGSVLQRSMRTALKMIDEGIKPGDHISLCTNHHLNSGVPHIASYLTGSIMAAIDPTMNVEEAAYLLKQTSPKIIFVGETSVSLVEKVVERIGTNTKIVVFGKTIHHTPFSEFVRPHKNEGKFEPREAKNSNEVALIVFSSGTSGMPKAICYSHFNMLCLSKLRTMDITQVMYTIANAYWNVFPIFLHLSIEFGFTRVVYPCFNSNDPWELFYQHVDVAFLNTLQLLEMVRSAKPEKADLKNVKVIHMGANHATLKQINEIQSALPHTIISKGYSQTEVFIAIMGFSLIPTQLEFIKTNIGSSGTVTEGRSYKIVDIETGQVLGPNQTGELLVKTSSQFIGYLNKDSSECFDSDGWLKTGDLFYYNEDFCFYYVDRIKESFKFYNIFICPIEIETVILNLEAVQNAIVIGIPHEIEYNRPMAIIKLKPNARDISAEEIEKHVEENLEDKKRLRGGVKFVKDFPMTVTGKVNRFKLKKMVLNNEI